MWLGDPRQYQYYDQLELLQQCLLDDYADWKLKYNIDEIGIDAQSRYVMPAENALGFMALPMVDARTVQEQFAHGWERSLDQLFKCPGMIDMCINFIRPGKQLPVHDDSNVWAWISESMGQPDQPVEGYTVSFGIHIPEPEKQCLVFGGEEKIWGTGEFRAFNGIHTQHYMHNQGSDWRITAVVEIDKQCWNL
jgi:hypothetical protein